MIVASREAAILVRVSTMNIPVDVSAELVQLSNLLFDVLNNRRGDPQQRRSRNFKTIETGIEVV